MVVGQETVKFLSKLSAKFPNAREFNLKAEEDLLVLRFLHYTLSIDKEAPNAIECLFERAMKLVDATHDHIKSEFDEECAKKIQDARDTWVRQEKNAAQADFVSSKVEFFSKPAAKVQGGDSAGSTAMRGTAIGNRRQTAAPIQFDGSDLSLISGFIDFNTSETPLEGSLILDSKISEVLRTSGSKPRGQASFVEESLDQRRGSEKSGERVSLVSERDWSLKPKVSQTASDSVLLVVPSHGVPPDRSAPLQDIVLPGKATQSNDSLTDKRTQNLTASDSQLRQKSTCEKSIDDILEERSYTCSQLLEQNVEAKLVHTLEGVGRESLEKIDAVIEGTQDFNTTLHTSLLYNFGPKVKRQAKENPKAPSVRSFDSEPFKKIILDCKDEKYHFTEIVRRFCMHYKLLFPEFEIVRENDVFRCTASFLGINFVSAYEYDKRDAKDGACRKIIEYVSRNWEYVFTSQGAFDAMGQEG